MKKLILLTLLTVAVSAMFAVKFDPDYFYSRSVIVCFTKDAVGNDTGKIDWSLQNGRAHTGLSSFDELAAEYGIVELQQMHPYVKVHTWKDNGI